MLEAHANDNRPLVVGFAIAVGLHLFVGVPVIARSFGIGDPTAMFTHSDARDEAERRRKERLAQALQDHQDNPPDPNEIPELIPGLEDGSETSMAWIGADEYQEHMARLGQVDQGGFRINDSGGGARVPGPPQSGPDAPPGPPEQPQPVAAPVQPPPELAREPQPTPPEPAAPQMAPTPAAPALQPSAPPIEAVRPATPAMPPEPIENAGTARPTPEPPPAEVPSGSDLPPAEPDPSGTAPKPLERPITPDPTPQPAPSAPEDPARTPEPTPRDTPPNQPPQMATPSSPSEPAPPPAPTPQQAPDPPRSPPQPVTPEPPPPQQAADPAQAQVPPAAQAPPGAGGASTPAPSGVIGPGEGPGRPDAGQRSDRESDATSVINVPPEKWRTGAPIAHKGVEILTRRPELPILTRLTTRPMHPVADLFFDNQGKPVSVKIVQSSGYPDDIDQPVIDALYRWRAKGSQLARLPEGKVARFRVRVILD
ncbi:MAG: hypothetical protein FGM37_04605 [Phycisphaerales bacterium]|nr:hypothetical protein [Phycisphaerales bacterium]